MIIKSDAPHRTRMRAHAVLLSARRFSIDQIAAIYEADRDRVSRWLERWKQFAFDGLADDARAGRPPKLSVGEKAQARQIIAEEPRSVRRAVAEIDRRLKKSESADVKAVAARGAAEVEAGAARFEKAAR